MSLLSLTIISHTPHSVWALISSVLFYRKPYKPHDSLCAQVINYLVILNQLVNALLYYYAIHVWCLAMASLFPNITSFVHYNWNDFFRAFPGYKKIFMYDGYVISLGMLINGSSRISPIPWGNRYSSEPVTDDDLAFDLVMVFVEFLYFMTEWI